LKKGKDMNKCIYDTGSVFYDIASVFIGIVEMFGDMPCDAQIMGALWLLGACGLGVLWFIIKMLRRLV
jgi:hypothetical protein